MPPTSIKIRRLAELVVERLVRILDRQDLVAAFIENYTQTNQRQAVASTTAQRRNLFAVIAREALLFLGSSVEESLSQRVVKPESDTKVKRGRRSRSQPTGPTGTNRSLVRFRAALVEALAWELRWKPEETATFRHDLELYLQVTQRGRITARSAKGSKNAASGPFVDRCAIVLDPSFFDKARRAAAVFQAQLERHAKASLSATLRYLAD